MPNFQSYHQQCRKFTNLADLDQFINQRFRDESGAEHHRLILGSVRQMSMYLDRLEFQIRRLATTMTPIMEQHKRGISLTQQGQFLWHVLRDADKKVYSELYEGRRLNPWLTVGLHLARKWGPTLRQYAFNNPNFLDVNHERPRRIMAHVTYVIRRICTSKRFRAQVNNDTRNAKENYISCASLMLDLFREKARLLILRVDLYFDGDAKIFSESEAANKAYNKFMRWLRDGRIVPDVVGYIGKRENGLEKRIHYHVLVALDGDAHQNAYHLTEQLGRFWVDQCVGARALAAHFNCWTRRRELEYPCMGVLHYMDSRMLMGLRLAMEYMCKEGNHLLVGDGMGRNLRKSIRPRLRDDAPRRGAPRKHGNDLHVVEQVLLTDVKVDRAWGIERAYLPSSIK